MILTSTSRNMNTNVIKNTQTMSVVPVHQPISDTITCNKYIEYRNDCQRVVTEDWCYINTYMLTIVRLKVKFGPAILVVYIPITTLSSMIMTPYIGLKNGLFLHPCCSENRTTGNTFGFCLTVSSCPISCNVRSKKPPSRWTS